MDESPRSEIPTPTPRLTIIDEGPGWGLIILPAALFVPLYIWAMSSAR